MKPPPADWQLPPGVSRPLWDYLHDAESARQDDERLTGTPLLQLDQSFVERHCTPPGRLIDLGCGTGRLLIPLAQRGYRVLGVDLSEERLRIAGRKAFEAGVSVDLLKANLVELDGLADGAFDYAACLFSTLGMIAGAAERARVVGHTYRLLRPGGTFVLHVHNRWFNVWDSGGRRWLLWDLVRRMLGKQGLGDRGMPAQHGLGGLMLHHFTWREAVRLLTGAGFRIVEVRPISLAPDGRLAWTWWVAWLRTYGYLLAARRPE